MQLVRVHGPDDVRLDDVSAPEMGPRDAIVRVAACGVCGSDLKYIALGGVAGPGPDPMPLGHELAGTVTDVGAEVTGITVGDRVVVHPGDDELGRMGNGAAEGGLTPRVLVREAARGNRLYPVPDTIDLEVAALAEPLAVGMNAADRAQVGPDDSVVIFGSGPIGLAALATLVDRGNERVIAIDLSSRRLDLAAELGAQATINGADPDLWDQVKALHGTAPFMFGPTAGTDAYIEASGAASVVRAVLDNAKPLARMSVVALHYADIPVSFLMLLMKQFTMCGAMEYPARFEAAIELLARRDLSALITHRYPLDDFARALATLGGSRECGKVMITIPET
jgi:(R,R)-butanediol dehydrogenase / meso-butanediol dehydrogenase / diacetyl reductase